MAWNEKWLTKGDLELSLVPDIGGRLMDIRYRGVSLLFQNPDLLSIIPDLSKLEHLPSKATHLNFPLWGGEKTWIAPDSAWPESAPYPALDSGRYAYHLNSPLRASMISPVCPLSSLQIERTITVSSSNSWTISHRVANKGDRARPAGIWSVMMTKRPAHYFFKTTDNNRPSTVFGNPRNAYSLAQDIGCVACGNQQEFKLGCHPASAQTLCKIPTNAGNVWISTRTQRLNRSKDYAHGHALEFYNSGHYEYAELEWHSPVVQLQPGKSVEFDLAYDIHVQHDGASPAEVFALTETDRFDEP